MWRSSAERIAAYVADPRRPSPDVADLAQIHIADTVACIYAGTGTDPVNILAGAHDWRGTSSDIPVPGWGYAKTLDAAALLLGTAAHALDFDDTSVSMPGHPSAPIVAALLVTGFDLGRDRAPALRGGDLIDAYVKGLEVACKIGQALGGDHTDQGWHTISSLGLLGAAVACAALRGLDASKAEDTLAIATSNAGGILNNSGTMVKPLHSGIAARAAYMAAAIADRGFTAGKDILAGDYGFVHAFTGGRRRDIELPPATETGTDLPPLSGDRFDLASPGLMKVKRFPCCQVAHPCIDAMIKIRNQPDFDPAQVESVVCYVATEKRMSYLQCPDPRTPTEARFSMNFTVATAMIFGSLTMDHFTREQLLSDDLRRQMRRIDMRLQDKTGRAAVDIEVRLRDGRCLSEHGQEGSITWDELEDKFMSCMSRASRPADASAVFAALKGLGSLENLRDLILFK